MKKIILRIILALSFVPAAFLLLGSIWSYFMGFTFFFTTEYGIEGAVGFIIIWALILTYMWILPICVIYQITILVIHFVKKHEEKKANKKKVEGEKSDNGNQ